MIEAILSKKLLELFFCHSATGEGELHLEDLSMGLQQSAQRRDIAAPTLHCICAVPQRGNPCQAPCPNAVHAPGVLTANNGNKSKHLIIFNWTHVPEVYSVLHFINDVLRQSIWSVRKKNKEVGAKCQRKRRRQTFFEETLGIFWFCEKFNEDDGDDDDDDDETVNKNIDVKWLLWRVVPEVLWRCKCFKICRNDHHTVAHVCLG